MAKKQTQFRLEEKFVNRLSSASNSMGISATEFVRHAVGLYLELHERMQDGKAKFYIKKETDKEPIEIIIPELR